jgi:hypothetical protein
MEIYETTLIAFIRHLQLFILLSHSTFFSVLKGILFGKRKELLFVEEISIENFSSIPSRNVECSTSIDNYGYWKS